jgi:hypothetical protein
VTTTFVCDDVCHWADTYAGPPFHALLCDPPYAIAFMNKAWDKQGIAFRPATWQALTRHLLPGAFVIACGGTRTAHRLACALEDAGLILHPSLGWAFAEGFPKATRIDTAIDKAAGATREPLPDGPYASRRTAPYPGNTGMVFGDDAYIRPEGQPRSAPATDRAKVWAAHRYGRQALKPAVEWLVVAQVPYAEAPVDSIVATGAGAWWIEGGRVAGPAPHHNYGRTSGQQSMAGPSAEAFDTPPEGRWPPNLALQHSPGCVRVGTKQVPGTHRPGPGTDSSKMGWHGRFLQEHTRQNYTAPDGTEAVPAYTCVPGCVVAALDAQAGEHPAGGAKDCRGQTHGYMHSRVSTRNQTYGSYEDTGGPSRFFPCFDWAAEVAEQLAEASPLYYTSKASQQERSAGLYTDRNPHPTIKPLALCRWLATLLLPPAAYAPRRLLVPFAGVGSEALGATLAGWDEVVGIEQDASYVAIAQRREAWWCAGQGALWPWHGGFASSR